MGKHHHLKRLPLYFVLSCLLTGAFLYFVPLYNASPGWMPELISDEGKQIDQLFWGLLITCVLILSIVTSLILYAVLHWRAEPGQLDDGPPIHGHHGLEITYTVIPAIIVTVIAFVSFVILIDIEEAPAKGNSVPVVVEAFQFGWAFSYPGTDVKSASELVLPIGKTADFTVTSREDDVIHAFWVPEARLKIDAVPGFEKPLQWTPNQVSDDGGDDPDNWEVVCAELCGSGHNAMRAPVRIVSEDDFEKWIDETETEQKKIADELAKSEGEGN